MNLTAIYLSWRVDMNAKKLAYYLGWVAVYVSSNLTSVTKPEKVNFTHQEQEFRTEDKRKDFFRMDDLKSEEKKRACQFESNLENYLKFLNPSLPYAIKREKGIQEIQKLRRLGIDMNKVLAGASQYMKYIQKESGSITKEKAYRVSLDCLKNGIHVDAVIDHASQWLNMERSRSFDMAMKRLLHIKRRQRVTDNTILRVHQRHFSRKKQCPSLLKP
jgi:hypothetical protein